MKLKYPGSLHGHTDWSNDRLRDSIISISSALKRAKELNHTVIGFTEHESVSGWMKLEEEIEKNENIKIIRGNEIYLCRNGLNNNNFNKDVDKYYHFLLLAKDITGAHQIMKISTRAWKRSYVDRLMRRVPTYYQDLYDIIKENPGHVIASTACIGGALGTQLLKYQKSQDEILYEKIKFWCNQLKNLFGEENFYLEMQPSHNKEQIYVNEQIIKLSNELDIPYIITTDSHYLSKEDRSIHKAYLNAQNGDREVDDFYATTYMMSNEEIYEYMEKYVGEEVLQKAFENIINIQNRCENYTLKKPLRIPELLWRNFNDYSIDEYNYYKTKMPYLDYFKNSSYRSDRYLVNAIIDGIKSHKDLQNEEAYKELEDNLERTWISSEVNKARWSAYYLNLQKNIDECWNAGTIVGPARGSGGGFLLLYCLDIIQMNKLRENATMVPWRFLNPERVSVLDIDTDIEGSKRSQVIKHLKEVYGEDNVINVSTFRTEKPKAAILTAARGLGIEVDKAQEIASLVPIDRGTPRTLHQCMYGDKDKDFQPIKQFVYEMTENYPKLWEVAERIEGLICGSGIHAGGIIFTDEPFINLTSLKRAPDGTLCTAFDLHDSEAQSLIKIDLLSVEAMDKIHTCIDLLCEQGYVERKDTLKETYESIIGIYNLERTDPKMWNMVKNHEINSLFQFEKMSGINGINLTNPRSVEELAVLNSVIRLMASEKGAEQPLDMWARYRKNINDWYNEMRSYGLKEKDVEWLSNYPGINNGICESQEGLMMLVQEEKLGHNSLTFADKCRKGIAKKQGKLFEECEKEYFENAKNKSCDDKLVNYVWNVLFKVQRGYSFNLSHTYSYSLIALQEMNLAYKYPIIFWNCACLITDSGGAENKEEDYEEIEDEEPLNYTEEIEDFGTPINEYKEEDEEGYECTIIVDEKGKKKKKARSANFGKIATAIGKMKAVGVEVTSPNINESGFTFSPDVDKNIIRFGLSGITRIGEELIYSIIENRPYSSIEDFLDKVKVNKPQMINLIKAGAFDSFGNSRKNVMEKYIRIISDQKKRITLQNMKMLIDFELLPEELEKQKRLFNFNKYLKKFKDGDYYLIDEIAFVYLEHNYSIDMLYPLENGFKIRQVDWDKIYKKDMEPVRVYFKEHQQELLDKLNNKLITEMWNKYCLGSINKWEMEAVSCYFNKHELDGINLRKYGIVDYFDLPENPEIERIIPIKGKEVPLFKIDRIAGTVLDRDKTKKIVTLLTTSGVVTVKIYGDIFTKYDKQISEKGIDGKKHVLEKSFFSRGNKIIVTGIRREDSFLAKKYSRTPYHLIELIEEINEDGTLKIRSNRIDETIGGDN